MPLPMINDGGTVVVRGFQQPMHESMLDLYFINELKSGGGPIDRIVMKEKVIFVMFADQESRFILKSYNFITDCFIAAIRVAERGRHVIVGQEVDVQLVTSEPATGEQLHTVTSANTLLIKGLNPQYHNKLTLELYFSNPAKCGGGNIAEIIMRDNEAYITYDEPGDKY